MSRAKSADSTKEPVELIAIPVGDARRIANDAEKAEALAASAETHARRYRQVLGDAWSHVRAFARILRRFVTRDYIAVPWRSMVMMVAALLYFVSPIDIVPDFLFGGMVDDVAVIAAVMRTVRRDVDAFHAWERARGVAPNAP